MSQSRGIARIPARIARCTARARARLRCRHDSMIPGRLGTTRVPNRAIAAIIPRPWIEPSITRSPRDRARHGAALRQRKGPCRCRDPLRDREYHRGHVGRRAGRGERDAQVWLHFLDALLRRRRLAQCRYPVLGRRGIRSTTALWCWGSRCGCRRRRRRGRRRERARICQTRRKG